MNVAPWAIGGYFGLEAGAGRAPSWALAAVAVQSGRMALRLALPPPPSAAALWLPAYFCPPVIRALATSGWRLRHYRLDDDLAPSDDLDPSSNDRVILVDFFGVCGQAVKHALARLDPQQVIVDASMAFFAMPVPGVPTVFSPRKFVGVPDGGFLVGPSGGASAGAPDEAASISRAAHLLKRTAGDVQGGRSDFAAAEASLDADAVPLAMSRVTRHWFDVIDFDTVASRRRRNVLRLVRGLRRLGFEPMDPAEQVPLCLPVPGMDPSRWRPRLAEHGIFCPMYWPDLDPENGGPVESRLMFETTYLPIDQRYGDEAMDYVLAVIDDLRKSK